MVVLLQCMSPVMAQQRTPAPRHTILDQLEIAALHYCPVTLQFSGWYRHLDVKHRTTIDAGGRPKPTAMGFDDRPISFGSMPVPVSSTETSTLWGVMNCGFHCQDAWAIWRQAI
jgi:hypothetical protein